MSFTFDPELAPDPVSERQAVWLLAAALDGDWDAIDGVLREISRSAERYERVLHALLTETLWTVVGVANHDAVRERVQSRIDELS